MLMAFDSKDCSTCPFLNFVQMAKEYRCNMSKVHLADDTNLPTLLPNVASGYHANSDEEKKPDGCPFKDFPNTIEIFCNA